MQPSEKPKRRIAPVQQDEIVFLQERTMLYRQVAFVHPVRIERRMQRNAVENILELRNPCHRTADGCCIRLWAKMGCHFRRVWQPQRGAVDRQQPEAMPGS